MARRGNNEGTIYQLPSGSWRAQIYINGYRLGKTKKTKREAQAWLRQTLEKTVQGYTGHGSNVLYKDFLRGWLSTKSSAVKKSTWRLYEGTIRNHIEPILGKIKINDIEPEDIQNLYFLKIEKSIGSRTIQVIHTVIKSSLETAVRMGVLQNNPTQSTTPPKYTSPEMDIYSEHEITQLLLAVKGTLLEALIHLAITTGLRQSELLALNWSDIDWDRKTISVQRQLRRKYVNRDYYSSLKTKSGRRTISVGMNTIQKLLEHHKNQIDEKEKMGDRWDENNLIFPSTIGTPIRQRNLLRGFKKIIRESGLREIRFHDLRHTAASLMLNHGISPIIVAKRLGHSKVSMTLDTYGHLLPGMQQESADYIDDLITPIPIKLHTNCTRNEEIDEVGLKHPNREGFTT
ncbi:MAG: site-specific integrase [Pelolinea sp.]|nr:site-specific integrase [Pelolinea sp.]